MATQLQLRRGTTAENEGFTGALAEVSVDTDTHELRVHDGSTQGGFIIPTKAETQEKAKCVVSGTHNYIAEGTDVGDNLVVLDTQLKSTNDTVGNKADQATTLAGYGITDGADTDLSNLTSAGKANVSKQGTYDPNETYNAGTVGEAITGKANTDMDNLTATGEARFAAKANVALDNLTSAGKEVCANLAMPSSRYDDLTLGAAGSTYTAPADGWFVLSATSTNTTSYVTLSAGPIYQSNTAEINDPESVLVPVKKGDVATIYYAGINLVMFRFVYANGAA